MHVFYWNWKNASNKDLSCLALGLDGTATCLVKLVLIVAQSSIDEIIQAKIMI